MNEGWIKLHRTIRQSAVFDDPDVLRVWIWILCEASFEARDTIADGTVIHLKPGQLIGGKRRIAAKIGSTESRVYRAIKLLEKLGSVSVRSVRRCPSFRC